MPNSLNPISGRFDFRGVNYVNKSTAPATTDYDGYTVPTIWVHDQLNQAYILVNKDSATQTSTWVTLGSIGFDFYDSVLAIAVCTSAPPTETLGARYIVDNTVGTVNAAWDGASKNDIAEFDGTVWVSNTPTAGGMCYVEALSTIYVFNGSAWVSISAAIPDMTETVKGVGELATDAESIAGSLTDYHVVNPSSLKAKLGTQTAHGVAIGAGTSTAFAWTNAGTAGQPLLSAGASADPNWGTLSVSYGGTGTTTLTSHGIVIGNGTSAVNITGTGNAGQILRSAGSGADPAYTTWTIAATTAQGDIPYSSADNTFSMLTKDATATRYISNTGTSNNPAWAQINLANGVTGTLPVANGGTGLTTLAQSDVFYVDKSGNDGNVGTDILHPKLTIQAAVTAASAGDTILVYPGTYTETITHAANNLTLIAQGKPNTVVITQANANVVNFSSYTGIQYKYFKIQCTAATSAINTIQGSTGNCIFKECQLNMTSAAAIVAVSQPAIGSITGAGTLSVRFGEHIYAHTGACGGSANKGAFKVGTGGTVQLQFINSIAISNSGTALVSSLGIDTASTGIFEINDCNISVTDPNATIVAGFAYLGGTGITHEFYRNEVHVTATNNTGYGFFSADTATTSRFFYNHIHVVDTAGSSYSFYVGAGSTVISQFDDIVAADGVNIVGTGVYTKVNSDIDGHLKLAGIGTVTATTDFFTITNHGQAASMTATGTGILFNQTYYHATLPVVVDAGRIAVITEGNWTSTVTTQDSKMSFQICLNGNVAEGMSLSSASKLNVSGDVQIPLDKAFYAGGDTGSGEDGVRVFSTGDDGYIDCKGGVGLHVRADDTNAGTTVATFWSGGTVSIGAQTAAGAFLDLEKAGTVSATTDFLELTNSGNSNSMASTGTGILFNQWYYDASTPAVADAARIYTFTEGSWTSTASTQNSSLSFQIVREGVMKSIIRLYSENDITFGPSETLSIWGDTRYGDLVGNATISLLGQGYYKQTGFSSLIGFDSGAGGIIFSTSPTGSAGTPITYTERMFLSAIGQLSVGTKTASSFVDIETTGTVTATLDILELTNKANAASMTATGTGILFNQWYYDGTPAVADAGRIKVETSGNWTSTASTQDARMKFGVATDGTINHYQHINSDGVIYITNTDADHAANGGRLEISKPSGGRGTGAYLAVADGGGNGNIFMNWNGGYLGIGEGLVYKPGDTNNIAAATGVTAAMLRTLIRVAGDGGAVTVTATPSIAAGEADGQIIILQGDHDTNTVTFQSEGTLASTGLWLSGGASFTMGKGDTLQLVWDDGYSLWFEVSRSNNSA